MPLLTIDHEKCKKDGICASECPFNLIVMRENDGFPEARAAAARLCIHCGHCLAVCPHGALSLDTAKPEECQPLDTKTAPSPAACAHMLKARRSIRTYRQTPVPHETLLAMLDLTRWAPSAKNEQAIHWMMITNPAEVKRLAGLTVDWLRTTGSYPGIVAAWDQGADMVLRAAPHLAIAHAEQNSLKPEVDASIALTYLDLAAASMGVGACWAGILMGAAQVHAPLLEALALPAGHRVYGAMMLGFAKFRYFRIPPRAALKVSWRS